MSALGWSEQLDRYRTTPAESYRHLVDEFVAMALNPRSALFGPGKSLADRLAAGHAETVLAMAADELATCRWALYRVRRCYTAPATAWRSLDVIARGMSRDRAHDLLAALGQRLDLTPEVDRDHRRLWLAAPTLDVPRVEELFTIAPEGAATKQRKGFHAQWQLHATPELLDLGDTAVSAATDLLR
ncbi:hypothetical protein IU469_30910 [Nocardia puris]|uniref:hypothetical protein n=2 Tax=Nocardia puris TaxID=208602 RepID=UPI0018936931|nr:hypothetical protein [Nocardia puris]MBF6370085.1 hypothetical protein [Nocardia puris]